MAALYLEHAGWGNQVQVRGQCIQLFFTKAGMLERRLPGSEQLLQQHGGNRVKLGMAHTRVCWGAWGQAYRKGRGEWDKGTLSADSVF